MRESGVLMHITSLPGSYGVGTMGKHAYEFIDFLQAAGQSYWQILPLNPTGYGDSPYQCCATFAGNPYLIDLDTLVEEGLLQANDLLTVSWSEQEDRVDFGALYQNRLAVLRKAFSNFSGGEEFDSFCRENSSWLSDFALYMALKEKNSGKAWYEWETPLKYRHPDAVWQARQALQRSICFYSFVQYLFFRQWERLCSYAHGRGIHIIGDVPIYIPYDSVDVWTNTELFQLDENLQPLKVAGCPPDDFTEDGQLWGNPLYRWDVLKKDGYAWWLRRMTAAARLYDVVRLDHFRGFESYWAVPAEDTTAKNGEWIKGPGLDFINTLRQKLPQLKLIAEDLGFLTPEVLEMLEKSELPGMKVLGFAFDSRENSPYLPHNHVPNSVCYTGTHDNMTSRQWLNTASADAVAYAAEYMQLTRQEGFVWGMIRTAMASVSQLCIIPMQDYLELGEEARMNCPGSLSNSNWTWRVKCGIITADLAQRIRRLTQLYDRMGNQY